MLSDEQIEALAEEHGSDIETFARAIEAEVRRQDTELIRQMLDALAWLALGVRPTGGLPIDAKAVITAARARLEPKP